MEVSSIQRLSSTVMCSCGMRTSVLNREISFIEGVVYSSSVNKCCGSFFFWNRSEDFLKGKLVRLQHELETEKRVEKRLTQDLTTAE